MSGCLLSKLIDQTKGAPQLIISFKFKNPNKFHKSLFALISSISCNRISELFCNSFNEILCNKAEL